jgi:uncharacterized coiled-coil protein SlyX
MDMDPAVIGPLIAGVSTISGLVGSLAKPALDFLTGNAQRHKDRIETLEARLDAQDEEIDDLRKTLTAKEGKIMSLSIQMGRLRQELEDGQSRFAHLVAEHATTKEHVEELVDQIKAMGAEPRPAPQHPPTPKPHPTRKRK